MPLERVAVIGAGAWGTALAQAAALAGRDVTLVARDPAVVDEINTHHTNTGISALSRCRPRSARPRASLAPIS